MSSPRPPPSRPADASTVPLAAAVHDLRAGVRTSHLIPAHTDRGAASGRGWRDAAAVRGRAPLIRVRAEMIGPGYAAVHLARARSPSARAIECDSMALRSTGVVVHSLGSNARYYLQYLMWHECTSRVPATHDTDQSRSVTVVANNVSAVMSAARSQAHIRPIAKRSSLSLWPTLMTTTRDVLMLMTRATKQNHARDRDFTRYALRLPSSSPSHLLLRTSVAQALSRRARDERAHYKSTSAPRAMADVRDRVIAGMHTCDCDASDSAARMRREFGAERTPLNGSGHLGVSLWLVTAPPGGAGNVKFRILRSAGEASGRSC
ncbi:hypothetical protein WOLCODRAFT_161096 [Wolfiporia cocos MD-104 SS10]|uniref:Uncharacterized protein n=1 Tax=Wolfiporia cocos (strain MD-104) TaxID=742152 RepID=A0A2H3J6H5_WOLCO|nr:hypothetical protein WOLCODRAFT_161096 [Wolfiporia cocos MD-104 SS10]